LNWYGNHRRDLPWRDTRDPYAIWISEIMLQQTQVATVIDYYHRFLSKFPTVYQLAAAEEQEVLQLWSGLGYYRRAKSLHAAARQVVEQFAGEFPTCVEKIQSLAGIGRYTAGAIASFAYDQPAPILEANTIRLFSRLIGLREPTHSSSAQSQLWKFANDILPGRSGSGKVNQAVMELGSLVCTPVDPNCPACPLRNHCQAHQSGIERQIPVIKPKPITQPLTHAGIVIRNPEGDLLMRQNAAGQWWDGLWDLPWIELKERSKISLTPSLRQEIASGFESQLGLACQVTDLVSIVRHAVTKYKVRYLCVSAQMLGRALPKEENWGWFSKHELPPVASRFRRIDWEKAG
jgi:A/G-specific adenine glycosylase